MAPVDGAGRPNQRRRTRKDLLDAATRLMRAGQRPSLEEIAEAAMVSRATAYRYFPSVEALVVEASLDVEFPRAEDVFGPGPPKDPAFRLGQADAAVSAMVAANEAPLRMMLAHSMEQAVRGESGLPARQNRRLPLIEGALEPARDQFAPADLELLGQALCLVIGTEAMVVFKDVLQLDEARAAQVRTWAIRALVAAARA